MARKHSTTRGFKRTSNILSDRIREAGESRGFAVSRLLTHWAEVVGQDIAAVARPVKIGYNRGGFGATLTVLTTGAQAPMLAMQKDRIRERVNGVYGYNAISRVLITQTAPTGFAEGQAQFTPAPKPQSVGPSKQIVDEAHRTTAGIGDNELRSALERLGQNVLSKHQT